MGIAQIAIDRGENVLDRRLRSERAAVCFDDALTLAFREFWHSMALLDVGNVRAAALYEADEAACAR